ncbi:MAG: hypothetical protein ACNA7V_14560 [Bacteroidales bacterium]
MEWLEQEDPIEPDPDDHDIIDETSRATFNSLGEIIIGENIYKVYPSGTMITIKNLDFQLLEMINGMDTLGLDTLRHPNFEFWYKAGQGQGIDTCDLKNEWKEKKEKENGDYKLKYKFKLNHKPWGSTLKAVTKNYKNKKKVATYCYAKVKYAQFYDSECNKQGDPIKDKLKEKSKKKKVRLPVNVSKNTAYIKNKECKSEHYGVGAIKDSIILKW